MISRKIAGLFLILVIASSVAYGATAVDIARRAQAADAKVSYRGTKAARILVGRKMVGSLMEVTHMKPDMTRTLYHSPSTLAGVVVVQGGPDVWKYDPHSHSWEQVHSAESMPDDVNLDGAFTNYVIRQMGEDTVAGHSTYVILASPKRKGEAYHRMWIDKQTYLTLRTQSERRPGSVISSTRFTRITLEPRDISPAAFELTGRVRAVAKAGRVDFHVEKPRYLPRGYKMVGQVKGRVSGHMCVHLQFSNGVNTISLFERRADETDTAPRVPDKLQTVMTWAKDQLLLTLIGDVSRSELKRIADSTR